MKDTFDNRVRAPVEWLSAVTALLCAVVTVPAAAWLFPLLPQASYLAAAVLALLCARRCLQGLRVLAYHRCLRGAPPGYHLAAGELPRRSGFLFLGRGFTWGRQHCQRLAEARMPVGQRLLQRGGTAAAGEDGEPLLHGVGLEDEHTVWLSQVARSGHLLVLGTTGSGKTRLAELLIAQDIRAGHCVVVFDPKGDWELLCRMAAETRRRGRLHHFHLFHLGFPACSHGYNPVGEFGRVTEVASRLAAQLPSQGNSAAFREFAWRFTNIVARALVKLGRKPDLRAIGGYLARIEPLLIDYCEHWLAHAGPPDWRERLQELRRDNRDRRAPPAQRGRDPHAVALMHYLRREDLGDEVSEGLLSAFAYDKTHFDKLTAGLLPLLDKLSSGNAGELLIPTLHDTRPLLDWRRILREGGVVYVGLDALADPEVAAAVGNCMFSDLASVAAAVYREGFAPGAGAPASPRPLFIHADEFNELVGAEFIPLLNKARGAGFHVTAYTQTLADIEVGMGDRARAEQAIGNLNGLLMLRVQDAQTAALLTDRLAEVRIYGKMMESRHTDDNDPSTTIDFVAQNADRLTETETPLLAPADLMALPRGQAFALLNGGRLYKLRLPLATSDPLRPGDIGELAAWCRQPP